MDGQYGGRGWEARLRAAQECASAGDAAGMLMHLGTTPIFDGLAQRLALAHKLVPRSVIDTAIGAACDSAYSRLKGGEPIRRLAGYLYKAAVCRVIDWVRRHDHIKEVITEPHKLQGYEDARSDELDEEARDGARREALRRIREAIPLLGGYQAQVMALVIDAAEIDNLELSSEDIGEALGIGANAVRMHKSRALDKLRKRLIAAGTKIDELRLRLEDDEDEYEDENENESEVA
jgi:RNA polymerase sigma factor (sigma-70 family)